MKIAVFVKSIHLTNPIREKLNLRQLVLLRYFPELKVKNGKANVDLDNWGGTADVTGLLQNHSKKDALNVEAGAGVFDKDNNFLGALFLSSDETITLGPTQSTGLQLGFPGIPSSEVKKIDHVDFSVSNVEYDVQD
ncbi:hypothetical protein [Priestia megaterium]|uniref:hypothetical protein n=1 Tax=Priestia megaterium TaxID=1404 RepID=UPI0021ACD5BA|nr:hypothetical protein [Priestia megaterium]